MPNLLRTGFITFIFLLLQNLCVANTDKGFLQPGDFLSNIISENNGLLKFMVVVLVIIVFGYGAKLLYERRFRKE